jgi:hypothetical protein
MIFEKTTKFRLIYILIAFSLLCITGTSLCHGQQTNKQVPATGELKLEGKSIIRLILRRQDNNEREEIRRPEQITELPTGKYYLHEVHLKGSYICQASRVSKRLQINITPDETASLKIGAPLKQIIKVSKQGRNLAMNYELIGMGGEKYTGGGKQPSFTIYKGEKEILSDKFKYG